MADVVALCIVSIIGSRESFGYVSFSNQASAVVSVVAMEPAIIAFLDFEDLLTFCDRYTRITASVMLKKMKNDKVIDYRRGRLVILNKDKIQGPGH